MNNRRTECEKGNIYEPHPDAGNGNIHLFAQIGANTEYSPFNMIPEIVHNTNIAKKLL